MAQMRITFGTGIGTALITTTLAFAGCSGKTFTEDSAQGAVTGGTCSAEGERADAADGCNTCECHSGTWSCTEIDCNDDPNCAEGTQKPAGDDCNSCTCTDGAWRCTTAYCEPTCVDGEEMPSPDGCNSCTCVDGQVACTNMYCPEPECQDGSAMGDACSTCECVSGQWECVGTPCSGPVCPAPLEVVEPGTACLTVIVYAKDPDTGSCCEYGDPCRAPAGWEQFYTEQECAGTACGGWLGDTCTETEYCAYVEGQMCGAADASATCQPRPDACDAIYDPVCGCDNETYSSSCDAAIAGVGVYASGPCTLQ